MAMDSKKNKNGKTDRLLLFLTQQKTKDSRNIFATDIKRLVIHKLFGRKALNLTPLMINVLPVCWAKNVRPTWLHPFPVDKIAQGTKALTRGIIGMASIKVVL